MKTRKSIISVFVAIAMMTFAVGGIASSHKNQSEHHHHHLKKRKIAKAGAGVAIGAVAGPGGSIAYGTVTHRRQLKAGGHQRRKAMVDIGAPVAAGVAFGPAGTAGYEVVHHRKWIKNHMPLVHHSHHLRHHHHSE